MKNKSKVTTILLNRRKEVKENLKLSSELIAKFTNSWVGCQKELIELDNAIIILKNKSRSKGRAEVWTPLSNPLVDKDIKVKRK